MKPNSSIFMFGYDHTCPNCGKIFLVKYVEEWAYKIKDKHNNASLVCSWHCLQDARRKRGIED